MIASSADPDVRGVVTAIPFLIGVDDADDVLVNKLRDGYIDLLDVTTEGVGPERTRAIRDDGRHEAIRRSTTRCSGSRSSRRSCRTSGKASPCRSRCGSTPITWWCGYATTRRSGRGSGSRTAPTRSRRRARSKRPSPPPAAERTTADRERRSDHLERGAVEQRLHVEVLSVGVELVVGRTLRALRTPRRSRTAAMSHRSWC